MKSILLVTLFISTISLGQNQITWGTTSTVSSSGFGYYFPRIVSDGAGNPLVSWSGNGDMYFSRWNGSAFSAPLALNPNASSIAGANWMGPDIASKGDTVFAVYKVVPDTDTNNHIYCTGSFDGGITFNTPIRVDYYLGNNVGRYPTITVDNQGNPIVGFMRFDPGYLNPRWVVARSNDMGASFSSSQLASGHSSATSEVCDCCPSKIISNGSTVAMPYRDNNNNIRDTWVGVSNDGGLTFPNGMDVDQQGWSIMSCPSSGPDAVIVGDSIFTTYMSAVTGASRVSYSISSISGMTGAAAIPLDQTTPTQLTYQNYPRVDYNANAMVFAWKQISNGTQELAIQFTENIVNGINTVQEIADTDRIGALDVMLFEGVIWVVWEDYIDGVVKYRSGTYSSFLEYDNLVKHDWFLSVQPNPSQNSWAIAGETLDENLHYQLISPTGVVIEKGNVGLVESKFNFNIDNTALKSGIFFLNIICDTSLRSVKLIKL
jgi:hypothetical protein